MVLLPQLYYLYSMFFLCSRILSKATFPLLLMGLIMLFLLSCQEPTGIDLPNSDAPEEIISLERGQELFSGYSHRRVPLIQKYEDSLSASPHPFVVGRYVEYDYRTIKQYLAFVETEAQRANVEVSSLRFYFANYPPRPNFPNGDSVVSPRRNTIMVMPTTVFEGEKMGFFIERIDDASRAVPMYRRTHAQGDNRGSLPEESKSAVNAASFISFGLTMAQETTTISLILNDGNVGPPPPIKDFNEN